MTRCRNKAVDCFICNVDFKPSSLNLPRQRLMARLVLMSICCPVHFLQLIQKRLAFDPLPYMQDVVCDHADLMHVALCMWTGRSLLSLKQTLKNSILCEAPQSIIKRFLGSFVEPLASGRCSTEVSATGTRDCLQINSHVIAAASTSCLQAMK